MSYKDEYYTPYTELTIESNCYEILRGFREISKRILEVTCIIDKVITGLVEEDAYQCALYEYEIELAELREELLEIVRLKRDKGCKYSEKIEYEFIYLEKELEKENLF